MNAMRPLLGTYVRIRVRGAPPEVSAPAVNAAFDAIALVQERMSAFDPHSDLGRIQRDAHHKAVCVHPWTYEVLQLAQGLHAQSEGLFDPGVAPQLAAWGLLPAGLSGSTSSSIMQLSLQNGQVRSAGPCHLDLGGIAKGFAVDRAIDALQAHGITCASVNAGGDLRVIGPEAEAIYLRQPHRPQPVLAGLLQDGACATSAIYFSQQTHAGQTISALVHPQRRQALQSPDSFSVIAPLCAVADALTKVLALTRQTTLPCFADFGAQPFITPCA
jgi:thiamine biosynthesis lipoprotein